MTEQRDVTALPLYDAVIEIGAILLLTDLTDETKLARVKARVEQALASSEASREVGWMRHAQTSDTEVAWLRKALGITSTEESCGIRDAMDRVYGTDKQPAALADLSRLTVAATRGAIWLEDAWRYEAKMWEQRCKEATRALMDSDALVKPPQAVLEAIDAWLEHEQPDGVEVTSEDVERSVRWSVVRQWREAAA